MALECFVRGVDDLSDGWIVVFLAPSIGEPADTKGARLQIGGRGKGEGGFVDGQSAAIEWVMSSNGRKDTRAVLGAAGKRADLVHGIGKCHSAIATDAAVGRAQARDTTECRRADDGAPGFRADGESGETSGDDRARTGRRAAGPAGGVPRIVSFALQGSRGVHVTEAASEFDHGGFAEENRAGVI